MKAKAPDESTLISALGLQDLREAIAEDYFLSEQEASGGVVFHTGVGSEYLHSGSITAMEPINLVHIRDLYGYVVIFRNGKFGHEIEGDLYEASSQAVDRMKVVVFFTERNNTIKCCF